MKKLTIILLLIAVIPATIFAGAFDFSIGTNFSTNQNISQLKNDFNPARINLGPEVRTKILFLEATGKAKIYTVDTTEDDNFVSVTGNLGLSLAFDLGFLRIGFGIISDPFYFGYGKDRFVAPEFAGSTDFLQGFLKSKVNWRANFDINLGHVVVGVDLTLPTTFVYGDKNQDIKTLLPTNIRAAMASVSFLYSFF